MAIALNLTAKLKQDPESQAALQQFVAAFPTAVQPKLDVVLREARTVHYARVLIIHNEYVQVLTEFDGDPMLYTEYFRRKLDTVFEKVFSVVEDAPPWDELNNTESFFKYTQKLNLKALGTSADGDPRRGYLFSAI